MKRWWILILLLGACREGNVETPTQTQLKLSRRPADRIALEVVGAPVGARAIQVVLSVDGAGAFTFADAAPPDGLPLDTVRIAAAGSNRAVLFAGDKRGVALPAFGDVATFVLSAADGASGRLIVESVVLSDAEGTSIPVDIGASLSVR